MWTIVYEENDGLFHSRQFQHSTTLNVRFCLGMSDALGRLHVSFCLSVGMKWASTRQSSEKAFVKTKEYVWLQNIDYV